MKNLRKLIGPNAFRALKERDATLKIWRNPSPHNWWVEGKSGKTYWHSDSSWATRRTPDLKLFQFVESEGLVYSGGFSHDDGRPALSVYKLKRPK